MSCRVGVFYGSTGHYNLVRYLEEWGLDYDETVDYMYGQVILRSL